MKKDRETMWRKNEEGARDGAREGEREGGGREKEAGGGRDGATERVWEGAREREGERERSREREGWGGGGGGHPWYIPASPQSIFRVSARIALAPVSCPLALIENWPSIP